MKDDTARPRLPDPPKDYSQSHFANVNLVMSQFHEQLLSQGPTAVGDFRVNGVVTVAEATDFTFGTTTGTKFGTATTQKIGFYNATPVVQQTFVADPAGGATVDAEARTAINSVLDKLIALGLMAAS